ncbi:hypothetical protein [Thermodesulfobacterium hveragerdense]|uniref:hypothetical protein n=1 Tax=Thermodesulfobacterium hveragerdense TaxID=53424 RepID=UPI0003F7A312|nr:hypothetical protein [Thermodesulfobacterium hveragerdense]
MPQKSLAFKILKTNLNFRSGLVNAFLKIFRIKTLMDQLMPLPGSNRGYSAWQYIQPILLILIEGAHIW